LTGHLNRRVDGVFEIVRVVGRGLVSIAEVHAKVARARAQSETEMTRDRFGLLEHHGAVHWRFRFLVASPPARDLLLFAKHLFVAAIAWQQCDLRRRCGSKKLSAEVTNSRKK